MTGIEEILKSKKFFVWDFDGCLCDSERSHFLAYAKAFANFGHVVNEIEYYASFTHLGNGTEREIERHNLSCTAQEISILKNIAYQEIIEAKNIPLFPEIPEIVGSLRKLGAKVAIASNSPTHEIFPILENNSLRHDFDLIVGRTSDLRKKPFPDIFVHTLSTWNAQPSEVLIFEDAEKGIEAAHRAQCDCAWIKTKFNSDLSSSFPRVAEVTHAELLAAVRHIS